MKTETVGIWDGDYKAIVALLCCKSQEIHIRTQGKKLIIKDTRLDFYRCIIPGEAIEIPYYGPTKDCTEIIGVWDGEFEYTEQILLEKNPLLVVKLQGKRLLVKDEAIDFYLCIPLGEPIVIPVYTTEEEDEPIILEEPMSPQKASSLSAQQEQMMREWGLLK